jgi:hypothetical protein
MGSCFHKTAEHHFLVKKTKGKNEKLSTLQDIFHESFKEKKKNTQWLKNEKPSDFEHEGIHLMLPAYYRERATKLDPKYVEEKFSLVLPKANARLTGTLDLILMDDEIRDHKTRQRRPDWLEAQKSIQGVSYTAGFVDKFGDWPKGFKLDFILRHKTYTEIEASKLVQHKKADIEAFKQTVEQIIQSIRLGLFYPKCEGNYLCSPNMCGYWAICHKGEWRRTGVFTKVFNSNY